MSNATILVGTFSQHVKHQVYKQKQHQLHTLTTVILHIKTVYSYYHVGPTPSSNLSHHTKATNYSLLMSQSVLLSNPPTFSYVQ